MIDTTSLDAPATMFDKLELIFIVLEMAIELWSLISNKPAPLERFDSRMNQAANVRVCRSVISADLRLFLISTY